MPTSQPFLKEFEIRWSDVDANRHLGNFAYINMMSHARMAALEHIGFGHKTMAKLQIGPIVLRESIHYFKEVFPGQKLRVGVALKSLSNDHRFFSFEQRFYLDNGENVALGEMTGSFISLLTRKISAPQKEILDGFNLIPKAEDFEYVEPSSIRLKDKIPIPLK